MFSEKYAKAVHKLRFVILLVWLGLGVGFGIFVMKFISATTQEFRAPLGTPSSRADETLNQRFPGHSAMSRFSVYVNYDRSGAVCAPSVLDVPSLPLFFQRLAYAAQAAAPRGPTGAALPVAVASYFDLKLAGANSLAQQLIDSGNCTTILSVEVPIQFTQDDALTFGETLQSATDGLRGETLLADPAALRQAGFDPDQIRVDVMGLPIFVTTVVKTVKKDMALMDAIVLPIAIIVMGITVRSVRLLVLPVLTIGLTLCVSFGGMYFVARHIEVSSTAPSLMMSLCIAMSVDYNLFILARYREELHTKFSTLQVVATVLGTAGHTILVSGLTLMLSCCGLIAFPMDLLRSFGLGCGLSIAIAMLVSLTLAPALLLTFPRFFEASAQPWSDWLPCLATCGRRRGRDDQDYSRDDANGSPGVSDPDVAKQRQQNQHRNGSSAHRVGLVAHNPYADDTSCSASSIGESSAILPATGHIDMQPTAAGGGGGLDQQQRGLNGAPALMGRSAHNAITMLDGGGMTPGAVAADPSKRAYATRYTSSSDGELLPVSAPRLVRALRFILRRPWNILVALTLLAAVSALILPVTKMQRTDKFSAYIARGSSFERSWNLFMDAFGEGYMEPYTLIFTFADDSVDAAGRLPRFNTSSEAWATVQAVIRSIVAANADLPGTHLGQFMGPPVVGGAFVPFQVAAPCLAGNALACADANVGLLAATQLSADRRALLVTFAPSFSPTGTSGPAVYDTLLSLITPEAIRRAAGDMENAPLLTGQLSGVGPQAMDAIAEIYRLFPVIICVTCGVVFLVVLVAFKGAFFIPLRSVLSIAVTEVFVFGMAVLVYQDGILDWLGAPAVRSTGAVTWIVPIVAFTVVVGVALDYDVFLITRINENYEEKGLDPEHCILYGVKSTAKIITAAGVIMAIAFFGLLLSSTQALNVLGFFLVVAVLFDTFVVRTLLVPTTMSVLGRLNWFPRQRSGGPTSGGFGTTEHSLSADDFHRDHNRTYSRIAAPAQKGGVGTTAGPAGATISGGFAAAEYHDDGKASTAAAAHGGRSVPSSVSPPRFSGPNRVGGVGHHKAPAVYAVPPPPPRRSSMSSAGMGPEDDPSVFADRLVPNTASSPRFGGGHENSSQRQLPTRASQYGTL